MASRSSLDLGSCDLMYKVVMVGNSGVGKSSLLIQYVDGSFSPTFVSTVGVDFRMTSVIKGDRSTKLQIWDTAGLEKYRAIITTYFRAAMGFVVMFDLTSTESFQAIQEWVSTIKELSLANVRLILVGNKCDLTENRKVSKEEAQKMAGSLGAQYFETSAKDDTNIKQTFEALADELRREFGGRMS